MNDEIILNIFSDRFFNLVKENNTDINMLAKKIGIKSKSTIYRYMNAEMSPKITTVKYLAEYYNVNPVWLMGYDVPKKIQKQSNINYYNKQAFPLLGIVKAGYDYLAGENIIGHINIDKEVADPENYFALKVTGHSMEPVLYEDDIVVVHRQNDVESGQTAIILIIDEEATVKKVIKYDDYIELVAFNMAYCPPRKLTKKDKFKIIGRVMEARISKIFE